MLLSLNILFSFEGFQQVEMGVKQVKEYFSVYDTHNMIWLFPQFLTLHLAPKCVDNFLHINHAIVSRMKFLLTVPRVVE